MQGCDTFWSAREIHHDSSTRYYTNSAHTECPQTNIWFLIFLTIVPETAVQVSLNSLQVPVAGYPYNLTCTVTLSPGLSLLPLIMWIANSTQLSNVTTSSLVSSDLTTNLTLAFNPLRVADEGMYSCVVNVSSPALLSPLSSSTSQYIDVQLSKDVLLQ